MAGRIELFVKTICACDIEVPRTGITHTSPGSSHYSDACIVVLYLYNQDVQPAPLQYNVSRPGKAAAGTPQNMRAGRKKRNVRIYWYFTEQLCVSMCQERRLHTYKREDQGDSKQTESMVGKQTAINLSKARDDGCVWWCVAWRVISNE